MKPEQEFENMLKHAVEIFGGEYSKVPDTRMINKDNRKSHREQKRPFDNTISSKNFNWLTECKINYASLKPHQKEKRDRINKLNKGFLVLRKIRKKNKIKVKYRIESAENRKFDFDSLDKMVKFILTLKPVDIK